MDTDNEDTLDLQELRRLALESSERHLRLVASEPTLEAQGENKECQELAPTWVRLGTKWTNLGLFKTSFLFIFLSTSELLKSHSFPKSDTPDLIACSYGDVTLFKILSFRKKGRYRCN